MVDIRADKLAIVDRRCRAAADPPPPGGGMREEWEAVAAHLRPADPGETPRAHMAEANAMIWRGPDWP